MKSKVVKIYEQGPANVLKIEENDVKKLSSNEVMIEHSYAGLNFIDINQRNGAYPLKNLPSIMGMEASGTIVEKGGDVSRFNVGDKVTHCMNLGSFSKLINLDEKRVIKLNNHIDLKVAAASTLQGLTAQYLINESFQLKDHHTVLVHAAAGGVGQILCQWAKKLGARVLGTISTKKKEYIAKENGCDYTINYVKDDFVKKVLEITNNKGADVIYDSVGKNTFQKGITCLAPKGRLVSFGISSGPIEPININQLRSFSGSIATGGLNTYIKDSNEMQKNADGFFKMIMNKDIKINIDRIFPIDDIQEAQTMLENRLSTGSIVLKI
jgi:NADPH2:quinone reductase